MKKIFYSFLFFFGLLIATQATQAQIPDDIILSLKAGNSKTLSNYFNQNVELVVLDNDNVYSKAQAQQIVGNFFSKFHPVGFSVIHTGGKEGAKYAIGNLKTSNGNFRVYFLLKQNQGKAYIHQLRIEKQNPREKRTE
ncbi:MAG: DUF4783 domain-containing protein [Prolixibacteraceae bacterium]|nr:DUF4783 domain-containing protein [Prolixibacteraceae bacterium]